MLSKKKPGGARRKTLSRDIAEVLTRRITSGQYEVGTKMPTERLLSIEFGVNRHAVREALKRLEAIGLIRIKHGAGIFIERANLTAGIEIFDTLLTNEDGSVNKAFLRDVLEFRRQMIMIIARLAVRRRKPRELGRICRLIDDLIFVQGKYESDEEARITIDLFEAMTAATHNQVYMLIHNTLSRIFWHLRNTFDLVLFYSEEDLVMMKQLREAFEFSNVEQAEEVVSRYLTYLEKAFQEHLQGVDAE
ncbi:MAG TPA: FadR family transcriptional regulator [Candidatus Hydrogenedentes bacterium]|nr:FadR family transcriptional regulator [Candidatus Hydrogenedentota bacterium]